MKIALIGPGIMEIPPKGWGAVELIIWEYYNVLKDMCEVDIINTPIRRDIVESVNKNKYDFVHIHYDVFVDIVEQLNSQHIAMTSHFPYIYQKSLHGEYAKVFQKMCSLERLMIFCLTQKDYDSFVESGVERSRLFLLPNGTKEDVNFTLEPTLFNRSIYLGKINDRKRQYLCRDIDSIDFVGRVEDVRMQGQPHCLGEWTRNEVESKLTNYGNLILLSKGESDPLVVKEALMAGLGVVISEHCVNDLDTTLPFIDVIKDSEMEGLKSVIERNREISVKMRGEIRDYAKVNYGWSRLICEYLDTIKCLLLKKKIVLIGPGLMPIPPTGWGACESLIWDYYCNLIKLRFDVSIINTSNQGEIIRQANAIHPDLIHIQYDDYATVLPHLKATNIFYTSHWAYQTKEGKRYPFTEVVVKNLPSNGVIMALSEDIERLFVSKGVPRNQIKVLHNGSREDMFRFTMKPLYPTKSICVAKIEMRKRQYLIQGVEGMVFVGNYQDSPFNKSRENYLGVWNKETLYNNLTDYANIVLLSDGEADPLVIKEGLMAGLGVVVSEFASANLDLSLPFIDVIPEAKINDGKYVEDIIRRNRIKSIENRHAIRKYALENFSWFNVVKRYVKFLG